ncbi:MAG: ATP-binding protein [Cyanobacteria bacterium P01_A01_bin.116]
MSVQNWKLSTKIVLAFSSLMVLGMGSLATGQYWQLRTSQRKAMADRLSEIVQLAAPQIDGDYHALVVEAQDANTTYYRINQEQLGKIQAASDDIQYLYTVRQQAEGHYSYVLEKWKEREASLVAVGEALAAPPPLLANQEVIESPVVEDKITYNSAGIPVLIGYAPIYGQFDRVDGLLVVELDARPVLARELQAQRSAAVTLLIIIIITFGTIRYLSQSLVVRPTLMLNQAAKRLAEGEWTATLPTQRYDEFGELAQSFNNMAQHLRDSFQKLEDYSQNLEAKVETRTKELSASQQLLNLVMNNIPQSIFWKNEKSVYLGCNQSFANVAGVSVDEIGGKTDDDLLWSAADAHFFAGCDRKVLESGAAKLGIVEPHQANGCQSWLEMSKVPLYDQGNNVMGLIGIFQDITPYKEAERAAHQASEAKSEFLANMNHELRTPLNGILGYTQILQGDAETGVRHKKGLRTIHQCATHLLSLINDILDFSKLEVQKMELHAQDFHLGDFLTATADMCRIKAEQKGVALVYDPGPNIPAAVHADPKKLRQVLINLLGNAAKFTDSGSVTFKATVSEPPAAGRTSWRILFQIQDTGIGIGQDQLEKIFRPFEQAGNSAHHSEGTGLGLAISRKIVQMMGSDIHVDSELGEGSTFWFEVELLAVREWCSEDQSLRQNEIAIGSQMETHQSQSQQNIHQQSQGQRNLNQQRQNQQGQANSEQNRVGHSQRSQMPTYIMPPVSELEMLHAAAKTGFMADVIQEAERIKALDEQYAPLANRILELSHQFDDKAILALVQSSFQEATVS